VPPRDYFAIYPISGIAQAIPLPAGPAESGIVFFYETAWLRLPEIQAELKTGTGTERAEKAKELGEAAGQQGLILALVYRLSTILIVPIGAAYYFLGGRSEVTEVLHEAEEEGGDGDRKVPASKIS